MNSLMLPNPNPPPSIIPNPKPSARPSPSPPPQKKKRLLGSVIHLLLWAPIGFPHLNCVLLEWDTGGVILADMLSENVGVSLSRVAVLVTVLWINYNTSFKERGLGRTVTVKLEARNKYFASERVATNTLRVKEWHEDTADALPELSVFHEAGSSWQI